MTYKTADKGMQIKPVFELYHKLLASQVVAGTFDEQGDVEQKEQGEVQDGVIGKAFPCR